MDRIEKRRPWMVRRRLDGWKIDDIAEALRVSEKTVDRWWSLYRKQRWQGLAVKSKAPHTHWKTPQETVQRALAKFLNEIRAKKVFPVHTENQHLFKSIARNVQIVERATEYKLQ